MSRLARPSAGRVRRLPGALAVAVAVATGACSSDPLGPALVEAPSVAGDWSYQATAVTGTVLGESVTCEYNFEMRLEESGMSFSGQYSNALLVCILFGQTQIVDGGEGDIVQGSLTGGNVTFDVDTENIRNTGRLEGDSMSGQVRIELTVQHDTNIGTLVVTGPWSAVR